MADWKSRLESIRPLFTLDGVILTIAARNEIKRAMKREGVKNRRNGREE